MPDKNVRKKITIDGSPVSEVDIHACALNLLYNFRNVPIEFEGDLYQANSLNDLDRQLVKSIINASMNGLNLNSKDWPASLTEQNDVAELLERLKTATRDVSVAIRERQHHVRNELSAR